MYFVFRLKNSQCFHSNGNDPVEREILIIKESEEIARVICLGSSLWLSQSAQNSWPYVEGTTEKSLSNIRKIRVYREVVW